MFQGKGVPPQREMIQLRKKMKGDAEDWLKGLLEVLEDPTRFKEVLLQHFGAGYDADAAKLQLTKIEHKAGMMGAQYSTLLQKDHQLGGT